MRLSQSSLLILATCVALVNCGKKKDDDDDVVASLAAANPASVAYPASLALAVFPNTTAQTSSLALMADDTKDATPAAKADEAQKIIKGEAASCVSAVMDKSDDEATAETCYQFDQDMIYGYNGTQLGTMNGKNAAGEACLIAFARANAKRVIKTVDKALGLAQAALCQRLKDGEISVPAVDAEVDLAAYLKKAFNDKITVTSATLKRKADSSDGFKVFRLKFDIVRKDGVSMKIYFIHSPKNDENTSYSGVMYLANDETSGSKLAETQKRLISIKYERADTAMKYSLLTARVNTKLADGAVGSDGQIDLNYGTDATFQTYTGYANANDAVSGTVQIQFSGNPVTNEGTFAYWQNPGSNYTERARGMIASLVFDATNNTLSGCATSGAAGTTSDGMSVRRAAKEGKTLEPNGAYHPFFNSSPGAECGAVSGPTSDSTGAYYSASCNGVTRKWYAPTGLTDGTAFVTQQQPSFYSKQCFKQSATTGAYEIDTSTGQKTNPAGYELVAVADTSKKIAAPTTPTVAAGVKKE